MEECKCCAKGRKILEDPVMKSKNAAARAAVEIVLESRASGAVIGLGSGSTAEIFVKELAGACGKESIIVVPSSVSTEKLARSLGMKIKKPDESLGWVWIYVDGADQVDPSLNLIKGRGGALLREKLVARHSSKFVVIVDEGKLVKKLGPVIPVEFAPKMWRGRVLKKIRALGGRGKLRKNKNGQGAFVTDNGNHILDCDFGKKKIDAALASKLNAVPGIVGTGFFDRELVSVVVVGRPEGGVKLFYNHHQQKHKTESRRASAIVRATNKKIGSAD